MLQLGAHVRMAIDPALAHCLLMRLGRRSLRRAVALDSAWGHPGMRLSRVSAWTGQFARAQARVSGATPDAQGRPHNDHLAQNPVGWETDAASIVPRKFIVSRVARRVA